MFHQIVLAALLTIAAAAPSANDIDAQVRVPLPVRVNDFDPNKISESHEFAIAEDLFEGLTTISATGAVVPGVAFRWVTGKKNGRVWTFYLRKDARWSNGEPVTANDFVYSLRREVSPVTASPSAEALARIAGAENIRLGKTKDLTTLGVRALNEHTLQITLATPTAWLPMLLTHLPRCQSLSRKS